jgi:hypothetical protein
MKKQMVIGLLLGGLLVLQSGTSKAVDTTVATTPAAAATDETVDQKKAKLGSFTDNLKASFKKLFGTKYEATSIMVGIPLPDKVTKMVDSAPGLIKNALEGLNNGKPLTSLNIEFEFGYGGAGADQTGDLALSKGFAHIDAKGGSAKIVELLLKIPGFPDEIAKPIKNLLGMKGGTVCLLKMIFLAKKDFTDPKTKKVDKDARYAFISKELPLLLTRLAFTQDFEGPASWIETFLKPLGLEPLLNDLKIDIDATTYYEWKREQVSKDQSAFYKELSTALDTSDIMARQKNLSDLLAKDKDTLKTIDFVDRDALVQVIGAMVDDLSDAYRKGSLKPETVALYTQGSAQGQPVDGAVGLIDLLNQAIAATTAAGNFGPIKPGNGKEPMQADLVASLNQMLTTVTTISTAGKLPDVAALPSKTVERLSVSVNDFLKVQYDSFMNNYWYREFEGDDGYVKPLPLRGTVITVGKDLAAVCVRVLQRYSDAVIAYKQSDEGKKAQAAIDAAQAGVKAATAAAIPLLAKDSKQTNDATKKAVAAVKAANDKVAAAKKGQFKAAIGVPVDFFYKWDTDAKTGVKTRVIIPGSKDTIANFLKREILRSFMALPQFDFIQGRLNAVLSIFGLSLSDLGITPDGMKSAAAKEQEKKAADTQKAGEDALAAALAANSDDSTAADDATDGTAAAGDDTTAAADATATPGAGATGDTTAAPTAAAAAKATPADAASVADDGDGDDSGDGDDTTATDAGTTPAAAAAA